MQGCIYVITNQINHKQYVGLTCKPVEVRLKEHFDTANRKDYPLSKAIRKYGKDKLELGKSYCGQCLKIIAPLYEELFLYTDFSFYDII